jgi:hypothetical protein
MNVTLLGKRYKLVFEKMPPGLHGECDAPDTKGKQIRISNKLRDERLLEILCHEIFHALNWRDDETIVDQSAKDLSRVLWSLGYRKINVDT